MNLDQFDKSMANAWECHEVGSDRRAFQELYQAILELAAQVHHAEKAHKRTADVASCLANGIKPD